VSTRIYVVNEKKSDPPVHRLVRAANKSQVMRHLASETWDAEVADQDTLVRLLSEKGLKVEEVTVDE
jgi:hypothetical protein